MAGGAWKAGSTRAWRNTRGGVLDRNRVDRGGVCALQVPGVCTGGQATCVHHICGRAVTGDDPAFLIASCRDCNAHVGQPGRRSPNPKRVSKW